MRADCDYSFTARNWNLVFDPEKLTFFISSEHKITYKSRVLVPLWKICKRISQLSPYDHATWQHPRENPRHVRGSARIYIPRMFTVIFLCLVLVEPKALCYRAYVWVRNAPVNWNPHPPTPGKYGAVMGVTKGFGTFLCPRGWGICCVLLHQFCPWGGGLVRFWHSWTSEDWGEWVVSMCFLIPKGGFKMDDIKVLCWFIFFPIKQRSRVIYYSFEID